MLLLSDCLSLPWTLPALAPGAALGSKMSQESFASGAGSFAASPLSEKLRCRDPFSGALRIDDALDWRDATERFCIGHEAVSKMAPGVPLVQRCPRSPFS